jgi:hypothetical protein
MVMPNQLTGLVSRIGKAEAVDGVVQSSFKKREKDFARNPLLAIGLLKVVTKLVLERPINSLHFLLFSQLGPVIRKLLPTLAMLPRRITPPVDGTLLRVAPLPFEKELQALPSTQSTNR